MYKMSPKKFCTENFLHLQKRCFCHVKLFFVRCTKKSKIFFCMSLKTLKIATKKNTGARCPASAPRWSRATPGWTRGSADYWSAPSRSPRPSRPLSCCVASNPSGHAPGHCLRGVRWPDRIFTCKKLRALIPELVVTRNILWCLIQRPLLHQHVEQLVPSTRTFHQPPPPSSITGWGDQPRPQLLKKRDKDSVFHSNKAKDFLVFLMNVFDYFR